MLSTQLVGSMLVSDQPAALPHDLAQFLDSRPGPAVYVATVRYSL